MAHDADALCVALASLLTTAPMAEMRLHACDLSDGAMRPLLASLRRAPHLRCFSWSKDDALLRYDARSAGDDDSLFRDIILPALQAPEPLTKLALPSGCALARTARALADARAALHDCIS
jgi:transposase